MPADAPYCNAAAEFELKRPGMEIINQKNYILIKPSKGILFKEILEGLSRLFSMHEYREKNDIWLFRDGRLGILFADLYELKDFAEKHCPKSIKGGKTAIVVEGGLQQSMATLYIAINKDISRQLKVFKDFNSAEEWIKE